MIPFLPWLRFGRTKLVLYPRLISEEHVRLERGTIRAALAVLHERFPDTPIYMTADALAHFKKTVERKLAGEKKYIPAETPDSVPTPEVLPDTRLSVDGQSVEIIPDLQGDVLEPTNSFVWIPSLRAVVAGDIAFNGVHVWLADSDEKSRARLDHDVLKSSFDGRLFLE
jgi:glyoxylase-like metal-dependent hydrolase (beta-lactamase superfamily II)